MSIPEECIWRDKDESKARFAIDGAMQQLLNLPLPDDAHAVLRRSLQPILRELFEDGFTAGVVNWAFRPPDPD